MKGHEKRTKPKFTGLPKDRWKTSPIMTNQQYAAFRH